MSEIQIRSAQSHAELHACVDLQIQVWGFPAKDAVPFNQLHAAHEWGGQVLIALDGAQMVGFCYGFAGRHGSQPALCSHMLAVLPGYRGREIGVGLKVAQARWAIANGYDLITWTYDPLEALNASLNIARLGGIARQYLVDHYGAMPDGLNRGMPSDRLLLEWHLRQPRVSQILAGEPSGDSSGPTPWTAPAPRAESPFRTEPAALTGHDVRRIEIPRSIQRLKQSDPAAALRWRLQVREQMQGALAAGYTVTGVRTIDQDRAEYLLTKEDPHAR